MGKRLNKIELERTVGIEFEGYTKNLDHIRNEGIENCNLHQDYSLNNAFGNNWSSAKPVGVEIVTIPFKNLDMINQVMGDLKKTGWLVGKNSAGTHVHVDISDYKLEDYLKLGVFTQAMEKVLLMTVKPYREGLTYQYDGFVRNRYCRPMRTNYSKLLDFAIESNFRCSQSDLRYSANHVAQSLVGEYNRANYNGFNNNAMYRPTRYDFINIFGTGKGTAEFRFFHATNTILESKKFALLAYQIIETVKHSTHEQLMFIIESVNNCDSPQEMLARFGDSIGLPYELTIMNKRIAKGIESAKRNFVLAV